jgi:hypothetical protein
VLFFLGGRRGTHTPKHFVNLTGESKNFKMLEFLLKQLQTYYGYLCDLLSFMYRMLATKMLIFLSQTESTPKHFVNLMGESKTLKSWNSR